MTLQVEGKGSVTMANLQVGDRVLTSSQQYETVYAFGHHNPSQKATFLQFYTANSNNNNDNKPLELTHKHMVFVQGKSNPVRADSLQVGDVLQSVNIESDNHHYKPASIRKIQSVQREGVYAPLTTGGTLVVNGIAASSYIPIHETTDNLEYVALQGTKIQIPIMSHQSSVHMVLAPFRLVCRATSWFGLCDTNSVLVYGSNGMPYYATAGIAFREMVAGEHHLLVQALVVLVAILLTGPFRVFEQALEQVGSGDVTTMTLVAAVVTTVAAAWMAASARKNRRSQVAARKMKNV